MLWRKPFSRQQIAFLNTSKIEHRSWKSLKKRNFRAQYKAAERMAMYGEEQLRKFINACECLFLPLWRVDWYVTHLSLFIRMFYEDMTAKEVLLTSLPRHTREEDIFNVFVGFVKETKLPLSNWCWWHCHESQVSFRLGKPRSWGQGRNEGCKGETISRDPNHCRGRRKVPTMSQVGYFLQYSTFASERPQVRTWRRQTWFLPQALPNPVTPLLGDEILTVQNDLEIKARSTSAQPGEHIVFWISTGGG